ncbi:MAG: bifunctional glutamate N-acetyltransferase/amino-acid acetyltransferase ArgJ [Collinsella sp.]
MLSSSISRSAVEGGVTAAAGFKAAGIHADSARIPSAWITRSSCPINPVPGPACLRLTPVRPQVSRANLGGADKGCGIIAGVSINSGNANAATGETGLACARETCNIASQVIGCEPQQILVASTGVIGQILPIDTFETAVPAAYEALSAHGGADAARAIMTTDTHSKEYAVCYRSEAAGHAGNAYTVGGMCKGSGMIMPNMATMIAVITTDAPVEPAALHALLLSTVKQTFNKVTVDSDTSTNDTCIMLASGAAANAEPIVEGSDAFDELAFAVHEVCESLARNIAADGEGASKLVTVNVTGAVNDEEADIAARAVANSPLVKTCIAGHDCNWGRVAMALGKCGVQFNPEDVSIDMMGMPVCRDGLTVPFDEDEALRRFEAPEIVISADLGAGDAATTVWTCDLTHEYISINGDYRS